MVTAAQRKSRRTIERYAKRKRERDVPRYVSPPIKVVTKIVGKPGEVPTITEVERKIGEPTPAPPVVEKPAPPPPTPPPITPRVAPTILPGYTPGAVIAPTPRKISAEAARLEREAKRLEPGLKKAVAVPAIIGVGIGVGVAKEIKETYEMLRHPIVSAKALWGFGKEVIEERGEPIFEIGAEFGRKLRATPLATTSEMVGRVAVWDLTGKGIGRVVETAKLRKAVVSDINKMTPNPVERAKALSKLREAEALQTGVKPYDIQLEKVKHLKGEAANVVESYLKKNPRLIVSGSTAEQAYLGKRGKLAGGVSDVDIHTTGFKNPHSAAQELGSELKEAGVKRVSVLTKMDKEGFPKGEITIEGKKAVEFHSAKQFLYPSAIAVKKIAPEVTLTVPTPKGIRIPKPEFLATREVVRAYTEPYKKARGLARFEQLRKAIVKPKKPIPKVELKPIRPRVRPKVPKVELKPLRRIVPKKKVVEKYPVYPEYPKVPVTYPVYPVEKKAPPYKAPPKEVPYKPPVLPKKVPDIYKGFVPSKRIPPKVPPPIRVPYKPYRPTRLPLVPLKVARPKIKEYPLVAARAKIVLPKIPRRRKLKVKKLPKYVTKPRVFKYVPSLTAQELKVMGKPIKFGKKEFLTGVTVRPIPKGFKFPKFPKVFKIKVPKL